MLRALGLAAMFALTACGAAVRGSDAQSGGGCHQHEHVTPAELADSPRADRNLEALAAALGGTVAADPAIYERLARDVAAARAVDASLAHVSYRTGHDGRTLLLEMESSARERVLAGNDPTFEALRARFGPMQVDTPYGWVALTLDRVFDLARLRDYYLRVPGVTDVGFNVLMGDGPTMCVDRDEADAPNGRASPGTPADNWTYWFLDAGGDCPAGCTTLRVVGLRTDRAGTMTWIGSSDTEGTGGLSPEAMAAAATCQEHASVRAAVSTAICP